jgi:hypothetical protein
MKPAKLNGETFGSTRRFLLFWLKNRAQELCCRAGVDIPTGIFRARWCLAKRNVLTGPQESLFLPATRVSRSGPVCIPYTEIGRTKVVET